MRHGLVEHAQEAYFVQRDGRTFLAVWVDFSAGASRRTKVTVYEHQRMLFPRTAIGLAAVEEEYEVSRDGVREWLVRRRYGILGGLQA